MAGLSVLLLREVCDWTHNLTLSPEGRSAAGRVSWSLEQAALWQLRRRSILMIGT